MVTKNRLGENPGPVSSTDNMSLCSVWILYSINRCVFLLDFLLIKRKGQQKGRKI